MTENKKYYKTHEEALKNRIKGSGIYYDPYKQEYYVIPPNPNKKSFWNMFEREQETHFYRYGRLWFTTEKEALENKEENEEIYFDKGMKAYYIKKPKKSIWNF